MGQNGQYGLAVLADPATEITGDEAFCAAVTAAVPGRRWTARDVWCHEEERDGQAIVIARVATAAELERALPGLGRTPVGIGAPRSGWDGARQSVADACDVLALGREGVARFEDEWLLATLAADRERLAVVCEDALSIARRSAHLADAVLAFADHGLSVVNAARALHIHSNTMIYRLDRWKALTGWDPRSFEGLARSVACLRMAR